MTSSASSSEARVPTEHASRYLQQLCKHWSHKFPATTFDAAHGVVPFDAATCTFDAAPDALVLRIEAAADNLERMEGVVARHLERFAFRETLAFDWKRSSASQL